MADYDVKAVAAALRELADINDRIYGPAGTSALHLRKRADELDPPKTRVDRIMERLKATTTEAQFSRGPWRFNENDIRKILEEEGI